MPLAIENLNWDAISFIAFFFAFPFIWMYGSMLIKWQMGWYVLEGKYRTQLLPPTSELFVTSGHFGPFPFNKVLLVALLPEGVLMEWVWLFSFKTKPILVPWEHLRSASIEGLFKKTVLRLYVEHIDIELRTGEEAFNKVPIVEGAR